MRSAESTARYRSSSEAQFMCAHAGPYRLVFELRTLLSIEGRAQVEHDAIRGPVDLREWLRVEPSEAGSSESLLVLGDQAVYRFVVDRIVSLERRDLKRVFPIPAVLSPLTRALHLRGVVELEDGLAYLVDPRPIAESQGLGG
jgi:hypothetical protein